ncbi:MAG: glycosyltransferase family 1 protein [bacterium]
MKIGVDCHVLAGKFQGSRTYLENLYREVVKLDNHNKYLFFGHWRGHYPFGGPDRHVEYRSPSRLKRLTYQTRPLIRQHDIELFHSTYISPLLMPCDRLLTVHDLLFETHPQFFKKAFVWRSRMLVRRSAVRARQVHTISQYCRQILVEQYRFHPDKVRIVPVGVDLERFSTRYRSDASELIARRFGVRDFLLTVGRLEPRKNHLGLFRAYAILRQYCPDVGPLVVIGQTDFGFEDILSAPRKLGIAEYVRFLPDVPDNRLADFYRAATMFVYPSFAEGLGIPPLEAMACGTPVVTSNTTAIPEVVGDCGLLVDPNNVEQIAAAMKSLLADTNLAADLARRGRLRAEDWSWTHAAKKYLQALDCLAAVAESGRSALNVTSGVK